MKVRGTQANITSIEVNVDTVYVRSNITKIEEEDFKGWEYDEVQYEKNEYIEFIANTSNDLKSESELIYNRIKTSSETYEERKNDDSLSLDELKTLRILKLKEECSNSIYKGFTSGVNTFGFNETDQVNFTQQLLVVVSGQSSDIQWKSKNNGVVTLSVNEFKQVIVDAEFHKRVQQQKYWSIEKDILDATDKESVKSIVWSE